MAGQPTAGTRQSQVQTYCVACQSAVGAMGSGGCKLACGILPMPASAICEWVQGFVSMCADIAAWLKQGLSPEEICKHLGYCGTECQCGVCSALSYPPPRLGVYLSQAHPSDRTRNAFLCTAPAAAGPAGRCLGFPNDCGNAHRPLPRALRAEHAEVGVCFDGQCGDRNSTGCCLTCF